METGLNKNGNGDGDSGSSGAQPVLEWMNLSYWLPATKGCEWIMQDAKIRTFPTA